MKKGKKPVWWRNSFYWFAIILLALALLGLIRGEGTIRDPGQVFESNLSFYYLLASAIMGANGYMTHRQAIQAFEEDEE